MRRFFDFLSRYTAMVWRAQRTDSSAGKPARLMEDCQICCTPRVPSGPNLPANARGCPDRPRARERGVGPLLAQPENSKKSVAG